MPTGQPLGGIVACFHVETTGSFIWTQIGYQI